MLCHPHTHNTSAHQHTKTHYRGQSETHQFRSVLFCLSSCLRPFCHQAAGDAKSGKRITHGLSGLNRADKAGHNDNYPMPLLSTTLPPFRIRLVGSALARLSWLSCSPEPQALSTAFGFRLALPLLLPRLLPRPCLSRAASRKPQSSSFGFTSSSPEPQAFFRDFFLGLAFTAALRATCDSRIVHRTDNFLRDPISAHQSCPFGGRMDFPCAPIKAVSCSLVLASASCIKAVSCIKAARLVGVWIFLASPSRLYPVASSWLPLPVSRLYPVSCIKAARLVGVWIFLASPSRLYPVSRLYPGFRFL